LSLSTSADPPDFLDASDKTSTNRAPHDLKRRGPIGADLAAATDANAAPRRRHMRQGTDAIEEVKTASGGDALRIRNHLPAMIERGYESLTKVEQDQHECDSRGDMPGAPVSLTNWWMLNQVPVTINVGC
jgi:hypothetical protein